jgi:hypothetical protein
MPLLSIPALQHLFGTDRCHADVVSVPACIKCSYGVSFPQRPHQALYGNIFSLPYLGKAWGETDQPTARWAHRNRRAIAID